jgi:hypothetical protein
VDTYLLSTGGPILSGLGVLLSTMGNLLSGFEDLLSTFSPLLSNPIKTTKNTKNSSYPISLFRWSTFFSHIPWPRSYLITLFRKNSPLLSTLNNLLSGFRVYCPLSLSYWLIADIYCPLSTFYCPTPRPCSKFSEIPTWIIQRTT